VTVMAEAPSVAMPGHDARGVVMHAVGFDRANRRHLIRVHARGHHHGVSVAQAGENRRRLLRRLPLAEDDFRKAGAQLAMMIQSGEAQVFERQRAKRVNYRLFAASSGLIFVQ